MSEQAKLTKLGKEVIPAELVGQNVEYTVLKQPAKSAYPSGSELRYSDAYISRLNGTYSLNDILGQNAEKIAQRKGVEQFVMDSPLKNSEGETVLGYMLIRSAQAGQWQPFVIDVPHLTDTRIKTAEEYLDDVEKISPRYNIGKLDAGLLFGIAVAKRGGLALPIKHDNKVIVVPSQAFVEYIAQHK